MVGTTRVTSRCVAHKTRVTSRLGVAATTFPGPLQSRLPVKMRTAPANAGKGFARSDSVSAKESKDERNHHQGCDYFL